LNRSATYDPSRWTITSIVSDGALILPYCANPAGWNFRESQVPIVETVIVDMIEEPVPGVMVVTEFEATGIRGPNAKPEQPKESRGTTPPKSEER